MNTSKRIVECFKWVCGTILTAVLPYIVAVFEWTADGFVENYLYYLPYGDTIILLYAVGISCVVLTINNDWGNAHKCLMIFLRIAAGFIVIFSALFYVFYRGKGMVSFNTIVLKIIIMLTVVNIVLGLWLVWVDNRDK